MFSISNFTILQDPSMDERVPIINMIWRREIFIMKKKCMAWITMAVMLGAASISGCSSKTETPASENQSGAAGEKSVKKENLRVITFFAGSDQWAPTWQEVIKEYMEANPNITISDESVPTAGNNDMFRPKMNADIAAGTPVDVALYFNGSDAEPLYESGLYVSWDQYLEEDSEWASSFRSTVMPSGQINNEQFNIPYIGSFEGLCYNQKIFDEYGLEYPTTWDNIIKACEVLADTDIIPISNSLLSPTCQLETMLLAQVGPENQKKPLDASWAGAIDQFKTLYDLGAFPADAATISDVDSRIIFQDGRAAMTFTGSWVLNTLKENQDMRMIAVPVPEGAQGQEGAIISVFGSGWYMSKAAAERSDAALNFVKYMCSPEILARFIEVGGTPAMNIEMPEEAEALLVSANEMTANATAMNPPIDTMIPREVFNNLAKKLIYVCEGEMTADELLEECRTALSNIKAN